MNHSAEDQQVGEDGRAERETPLEALLTYRISILAKLLDRRTVAMLQESCGLNVAEWRVLAQLAENSPTTVRWLAARMRVDRAEVSRAAAALERRGFAARSPDPADARSVLLDATPAGRDLYDRIMPKREALHRELVATLSDDEMAALVSALRIITNKLTA